MSACLRYMKVQDPRVATGGLAEASLLLRIWVLKFSAISRLHRRGTKCADGQFLRVDQGFDDQPANPAYSMSSR